MHKCATMSSCECTPPPRRDKWLLQKRVCRARARAALSARSCSSPSQRSVSVVLSSRVAACDSTPKSAGRSLPVPVASPDTHSERRALSVHSNQRESVSLRSARFECAVHRWPWAMTCFAWRASSSGPSGQVLSSSGKLAGRSLCVDIYHYL